MGASVVFRSTDDVDLSRSPQALINTIAFEAGSRYAVGAIAPPEGVPRPVRITAVRVVHLRGVEIVGIGALEEPVVGIGLVPGWPPESRPGDPPYELRDPLADGVTLEGRFEIVLGIRVLEPKSGLRGVVLEWIDGSGARGRRVVDIAVVGCNRAACPTEPDGEELAMELGLLTPE